MTWKLPITLWDDGDEMIASYARCDCKVMINTDAVMNIICNISFLSASEVELFIFL